MSFDVQTYSPSEVFITFGGAFVEGWESIKITRSTPAFKTIQGIRGKNTRVRLNNSAAVIEIALAQTSHTNEIFTQIAKIDEQTGGARIEVTIKDSLGTEVFNSVDAYIESPADKTFEAEISSRVWRLNCITSNTTEAGGGISMGSIFSTVSNLFS